MLIWNTSYAIPWDESWPSCTPRDPSSLDPMRLSLKGLSHEIDFKNFDKNLQNLA